MGKKRTLGELADSLAAADQPERKPLGEIADSLASATSQTTPFPPAPTPESTPTGAASGPAMPSPASSGGSPAPSPTAGAPDLAPGERRIADSYFEAPTEAPLPLTPERLREQRQRFSGIKAATTEDLHAEAVRQALLKGVSEDMPFSTKSAPKELPTFLPNGPATIKVEPREDHMATAYHYYLSVADPGYLKELERKQEPGGPWKPTVNENDRLDYRLGMLNFQNEALKTFVDKAGGMENLSEAGQQEVAKTSQYVQDQYKQLGQQFPTAYDQRVKDQAAQAITDLSYQLAKGNPWMPGSMAILAKEQVVKPFAATLAGFGGSLLKMKNHIEDDPEGYKEVQQSLDHMMGPQGIYGGAMKTKGSAFADGGVDYEKVMPRLSEQFANLLVFAGTGTAGKLPLYASSYVMAHEQYFDEGLAAGMSKTEADTYAWTGANVQSALQFISPLEFGATKGEMAAIMRRSAKDLAAGKGAKEAMEPLAKYVAKNVASETTQEYSQDLADNAHKTATNLLLGGRVVDDTYTLQQFMDTGLLTALTTGIFSGLNHGASTRSPVYHQSILWAVNSPEQFSKSMEGAGLTAQQKATAQERVDDYRKVLNGMPKGPMTSDRMDIADLLVEKERLKREAKDAVVDPTVASVAGDPIQAEAAKVEEALKEKLGVKEDVKEQAAAVADKKEPETKPAAPKPERDELDDLLEQAAKDEQVKAKNDERATGEVDKKAVGGKPEGGVRSTKAAQGANDERAVQPDGGSKGAETDQRIDAELPSPGGRVQREGDGDNTGIVRATSGEVGSATTPVPGRPGDGKVGAAVVPGTTETPADQAAAAALPAVPGPGSFKRENPEPVAEPTVLDEQKGKGGKHAIEYAIPGLEEYRTVAVKGPGGWTVLEGNTGASITTQTEGTAALAIARAKEVMERAGKEKLDAVIGKAVAAQGEVEVQSPKSKVQSPEQGAGEPQVSESTAGMVHVVKPGATPEGGFKKEPESKLEDATASIDDERFLAENGVPLNKGPLTTKGGRTVYPPKQKGRLSQRLQQIDNWLVDQGIEEFSDADPLGSAKQRDNDYKLGIVKGMLGKDGKVNLSPSDRTVLNELLWDENSQAPKELATWMGQEHKITRSGKDSYFHREDGSKVLWPGMTSKQKVAEAQFWNDKLKAGEITSKEYTEHLDRILERTPPPLASKNETNVPLTEQSDGTEQLDKPSAGALEGVSTDAVQGIAPSGETGRSVEERGGTDVRGTERTGGVRDEAAGGVGDGEAAVPVPAGGEQVGVAREKQPADGVTAENTGTDFAIQDGDDIGTGGAKTKYKNNLSAIRLLKQIEGEKRPATRQEQAALAKYVGWGGIPDAFMRSDGGAAKGWEKEVAELKAILTPEEYKAAAASTRNAHYTSPEIIDAMWKAVRRLGFDGGRILEPSVGVGNFFGMMPKDLRNGSNLHGVELDPITGGIAKLLYPKADIAAPMGFQEFTAPDGYFDAVVGNPPFGSEQLYDKNRKDLSKFSIHNYFFAKGMDTLKPNGVMSMVVTNRMMDAHRDHARQYLTDRAELLGAIRLPNDAFLKNAGTSVTTDILFFRRLAEGEKPTGETWTDVKDYTDANGKVVPLNEYFHRHPEMMLGDFGQHGSMYRPDDSALIARAGQDTPALLQEAIGRLPEGVIASAQHAPTVEPLQRAADAETAKVGSMFMSGDEVMLRDPDSLGKATAHAVEFPNAKAKERVTGMVHVRDALTALRREQLSDDTTDARLNKARERLNTIYDRFVKSNGPINLDANKRLFRDDPTWPQISALENNFDRGVSADVAKKTGGVAQKPSADKAAIFSKRTQSPYQRPTTAVDAKDALVTSLSELGRVDMGYMTDLYGKSEETVVKELGDLLFQDPDKGWVTQDEYLSGNVKAKLAQAKDALKNDPSMKRNVDELTKVQPEDVEAVDIKVKPGAHWLPPQVMSDFGMFIAESNTAQAYYDPGKAKWSFDNVRPSTVAQNKYATDRVSVQQVLNAAANQRPITVHDKNYDGTLKVNDTETKLANDRVETVREEWNNWIWSNDARRTKLSRMYNDMFNTTIERKYDGSHLTLPGKVGNDIIELRPHQANAVWRIVQSDSMLADHVVGAGKTYTLVAGAMELRRMGLAKKPMFVVPNHLVGQWAVDFSRLYPGASVLSTRKEDFNKENRKRLFARITTGDWDAVVVAHSSFGRVKVDPADEAAFIQEQIDDLQASQEALRLSEGGKSRNVKQMEKQMITLQQRMREKLDAGNKDDSLYWSELGVDGLFVDEFHEFKNLAYSTSMTRVAGLGDKKGSAKATDMFLKIRQVKKRGGKIVTATGTPISNTMAEAYTMQRYMDYDALKEQGTAHFDAWARQFGEVVNAWGLSPAGQYKMYSRFAKFVNMPELQQRYRSFGDVITRKDIERQLAAIGKTLPIPPLKGGKPRNVVVERSPMQAAYIGEEILDKDGNGTGQFPKGSLIWRSENLPKKPEKGADNMLKIMSDARKAALDMRLIDPTLPDHPGSKVNVAADSIKKLYTETTPGRGTQLVFIDLSTPKQSRTKEAERIRNLVKAAEEGDDQAQEVLDNMSPDELSALDSDFSVYDDLKTKLLDRGIPMNEIAFIHDANTDLQKEELFAKVNNGSVRVLLGSTAKMGAGMNVQQRVVGLHHLDAPWRPSDLEQRDGRAERQGNLFYTKPEDGRENPLYDPNFALDMSRYATKGTLDSRMWQTLEEKATFVGQFRNGDLTQREIEDVGGEAMNSAEMKAAASGNPLILEEMNLKRRVKDLEDEKKGYERTQFRLRDSIKKTESQIAADTESQKAYAADSQIAVPEKFAVTIDGKNYDARKEAGAAILRLAKAGKMGTIGNYGGFKLAIARDPEKGTPSVVVRGTMDHETEQFNPLIADAQGLMQRVTNAVNALDKVAERYAGRVEKAKSELPRLRSQVKDWDKNLDLATSKEQHKAVIDALRPKKKEAQAEEGAAPEAGDIQEQRGGSDTPATGILHVDNVVRALKEVAPGVTVTLHKTGAEFTAAAKGQNVDNGAAFYDPKTNAIHINLARAKDNTLFHEAAHPVLSAAVANHPELLNDLYDQLKDDLDFAKYKKFGEQYADKDEATQRAEAVVEYMADVASGKARSSARPDSLYQKFKAWIRKMLAKLGFGRINLDPTNLRKFAEGFAQAVNEGRTIRGKKVKQGERTSLQHDADRLVDGWYSRLDDAVVNKGNTQSAADWSKWMEARAKDGSLSAEEVKWTGLGDWLAGKGKEKVTPKEVRDFLRDNRVSVDVTTLDSEAAATDGSADPAKFSQYQLHGGTNYREVLVTLPVKKAPKGKVPDLKKEGWSVRIEKTNDFTGQMEFRVFGPDGSFAGMRSGAPIMTEDEALRDWAISQNIREGEKADRSLVFKSSHFDEPNILVHLRVNDRTDADGKKVLFVEEMQSDWGQKGKREGFASGESVKELVALREKATERANKIETDFHSNVPGVTAQDMDAAWNDAAAITTRINEAAKHTPSAPFVTSTGAWVELGLKQAIRMAVDGGYDKIAWANGAQQVNHYREALQKNVDRIEWTKTPEGIQLLGSKNGVKTVDTTESENALSDAIGKSMGDKIINDPGQNGVIEGDDITISDTGMAGFYDKILPNVAKKVSKKLGGDGVVQDAELRGLSPDVSVSGMSISDPGKRVTRKEKSRDLQQSITITPEMRAKVGMGTPLMQRMGIPAVAEALIKRGITDPEAIAQELEKRGRPGMVSDVQEAVKAQLADATAGTGKGKEKRKLTQRVLASDEIDPAIKEAFTENAIYYDRLPHSVSKEQANALLETMTDAEVEHAVLDTKNGMHMATRFIMGIEQMRRYNDAKDFDAASRFYDKFVPLTTEAGQGIAALRELGSVMGKDMLVDKAKRDLRAGDKGREMTEAEEAEIKRLSARVEKAPEGRPKFDAMEDLLGYQAKLQGADWWETPMAIWYANILSGPKTYAKNFIANAANSLALYTNAVAQRPSTAMWLARGYVHGIKRGVLEAGATWDTGYSPIRGKLEVPTLLERVDFVGGKMNPYNYLKYVRRAMVAADVMFFEPLKEMRAYQQSLALASEELDPDLPGYAVRQRAYELMGRHSDTLEKAKAQAEAEYQEQLKEVTDTAGIRKAKRDRSRRVYELTEMARPEQMNEDTHSYAARGTYNYSPEGMLGYAAKGIQNMSSGKGWPVKLIVPFTNIIANVTNDAINYSPAGVLRAAMGRQTFGTYNTKPLSREERSDLYYKGVIGMALMAAAYALSSPGDDDEEPFITITANGTGDYRKNEELRKSGWQPYSVKLGNTWVSYQYTPLLLGLSYIGNIRDFEKYRKAKLSDTYFTKATVPASWAVTTMLDQTFISSLNNFTSSLMDPRNEDRSDDAMASAAGILRGLALPNLYTQTAHATQDYFDVPMKEVRGSHLGRFVQDLPVARDAYENKVNALGEPVLGDQSTFVNQDPGDPVWDLIAEKKAWIGVPNKNALSIVDAGEHKAVNLFLSTGGTLKKGELKDRLLTEAEYHAFCVDRGQYIKHELTTELEAWKKLEPEAAQEAMKRLKTEASKWAKLRLYLRLSGELSTEGKGAAPK